MPPEADALACPSLKPAQEIATVCEVESEMAEGSFKVTVLDVAIHPLASVTVTVYEPAPRPEKVPDP